MENAGSRLRKLIVHQVGNKLQDEGVVLSRKAIDLDALADRRGALESWFLSPFKEPVFHCFHHVTSIDLNEVYSVASKVFESPAVFYHKSRELASLLYEYSTHPKVKRGECYVAYLEDCEIGGEYTDAIAIFKTEIREPFIKVIDEDGNLTLEFEDGISLTKPEKGCIIYNTHHEDGYRVCVVDNQSQQEAQYWKDSFLKVVPVADNYYYTEHYLNLARSFVTERLDDDFEVTRADQIDYLNRSLDYFKKHEQFDEMEFASEVFAHREVIDSFRDYKKDFQIQHDLQVVGEFDIATSAVKRNARIFKSVLKLDRNFHIYIHGDRTLIERGEDPDGRKWYKLYFREES